MGVDQAAGIGLIPASAGSTGEYRAILRVVWAHPRVCGEHASVTARPLHMSGSSPRLRGARMAAWMTGRAMRLIPASAGSTLTPF